MTKQSNETFNCPHCGEEQEGVIDDYAIAGRVGIESESDTQCGYCDGWFRVVKDPDGTFNVDVSE
jgi:hypothetical protein